MIKLLILGSGNIGPINILTKNLRDFSKHQYQIDGLNLYKKGKENKNVEYKYIDTNIDIAQKTSLFELSIKEAIHVILNASTLSIITKSLTYKNIRTRKVFKQIIHSLLKRQQSKKICKFSSYYDIVNVHYLGNWQAEIIPHIPKKTRVVITFWGSDLMATAEPLIYSLQYNACKRADSITVASSEMKEIVLSKFGRELTTKITIAPFGVEKVYFNKLTLEKEKYIEIGYNFFHAINIDIKKYKFRIKLGYSAFETQNHLEVLKELSLLPTEILNQIFIIIPMTYGFCVDGYKEEVESFMKSLPIFGIVLKNHLTEDEALSLSCITNIMLNLRDNDAFNSSMTESLISGALVINGGWLPYKQLKEKELHYIEIFEIKQLHSRLTEALIKLDIQLTNCKNNAKIIENWIVGENLIENWERSYGLIKSNKHLEQS